MKTDSDGYLICPACKSRSVRTSSYASTMALVKRVRLFCSGWRWYRCRKCNTPFVSKKGVKLFG